MKQLALFLSICACSLNMAAQCNLNPTITPNAPILCPNTTDTLWTQQFDSYQWLQNGSPIAGATNQYYEISAFNDAGTYFSVVVTQDTCVDTSAVILVDGWAFLPVTVMSLGSTGWGDFLHYCNGDTLILVMMQPYDTLIQWYDGANPIAGATDDTLLVMQSGNYWVEGAPTICPNFMQSLGVTIPAIFGGPATPVITQQGIQLVCTVSGSVSYQWYFNGNPITGATSSAYTPTQSGLYTCEVTDSDGCSAMGQTYTYTVGVAELQNGSYISLYPNPAENNLVIIIRDVENAATELIVRDALGREVQRMSATKGEIHLDLSAYESGFYFAELRDKTGGKISAARFVKR